MAADAAWIARVRELGFNMIAVGTDHGAADGRRAGRIVGHVEAQAR